MYLKMQAAARLKKEQKRQELMRKGGIVEEEKTTESIDDYYKKLAEEGKVNAYINFGNACRKFVEHPTFLSFMNFVIVSAGLLVGLQTYESMNQPPASTYIVAIDWVILVLFTVEVVLKIFAHPLKPLHFFYGPQWTWNWFDFLIVVLCMPFMPFGNAAAALRLLRVMRVLKLLSKNPQLAMILVGLGAGLKSASFISLLMFLVFYMYATFALMMLKPNDPWHFGDYYKTFITLYRMSTLEDWTDVMYMNYYGCDEYTIGGGVIYVAPRNESDLIEFPGPTRNRSAAFPDSTVETVCATPEASPVTSYIFFHTFIIISALILISMFIGAITIAMLGTLGDMNEAKIIHAQMHNEQKKKEMYERLASSDTKMKVAEKMRVHRIVKNLHRALGQEYNETFNKKEMAGLSSGWAKCYFRFGMMCRKFSMTSIFQNFIALVIVFAGILVGAVTDGYVQENAMVENTIVCIFGFECIVKIIGEIFDPLNYFNDGWNCFDAVIVLLSIPWPFLEIGNLAVIMRLLRLLRVLKLLRAVPRLQMIVSALINGLSSIGYIGIILILCFYLFAICGVIFFAENDPWHFQNVHLAMMTLFRASTFEDWTDIMYTNSMGCDNFAAFPYSDYPAECVKPYAAGSFAILFFCFFVCICGMILLTLFIGIIAAEMEDCASKQQAHAKCVADVNKLVKEKKVPLRDVKFYRKLFTLIDELDASNAVDIYELKGCLSMISANPPDEQTLLDQFDRFDTMSQGSLNFFQFVCFMNSASWLPGDVQETVEDALGITFIQQANALFEEEDEEEDPILDEKEEVAPAIIAGSNAGCCSNLLYVRGGRWFHGLTTSDSFQNISLGVVLFAGILVGLQVGYQMEDDPVVTALDWAVLAFFIFEVLAKIYSYPLRPWSYFIGEGWGWNWFDFLIVVASLPGVPIDGAAVLRLLRLARLIKIIDKIPKLKVIVAGLAAGLSSVMYILLLIGLVFYIYAVLGVEMFKLNDPWHFGNIALTFETLFRCATLEDWTDVWYTNYYGCKYYNNGIYVTNKTNVKIGKYFCTDIASPVIATTYFISFIALSAFVLLSLFVGCILISIMESVDKINVEVKENKKLQRREKRKLATDAKDTLEERKRKQAVARNIFKAWLGSEEITTENPLDQGKLAKFAATHLGNIARKAKDNPSGKSDGSGLEPFVDPKVDLNVVEANENLKGLAKAYFLAACWFKGLVEDPIFQGFITLCIIIASVMVGILAANGSGNESSAMKILDQVIGAIFLFEVVAKIVSCNFHPSRYFYESKKGVNGWNLLDFVIVVGSYTPVGSLALLLRMVRLLRILKMLKVLPELRMLVIALVNSFASINFVCMLMFLVFYTFAIFSMILFRANDKWHFDNLHITIMTLFRIATGEDWTDVMYTAQYGCKEYGVCGGGCKSDGCGTNPTAFGFWAVTYFVFFFTIGGLVFLNLFIGVITAGMADSIVEVEEDLEIEDKVSKLQIQDNISYEVTDHLDFAFKLLDVTEFGRLDQDDLVFALRVLHLEPSHSDLEAMMDSEDGMLDRCTWIKALTTQHVIIRMKNNAGTHDLEHLDAQEQADLSEENMNKLQHGDALHLQGPLQNLANQRLHRVGLDDDIEGMTDQIRHQLHLHTNHYAKHPKKVEENHEHVEATPLGDLEMSELMVAKKVVV